MEIPSSQLPALSLRPPLSNIEHPRRVPRPAPLWQRLKPALRRLPWWPSTRRAPGGGCQGCA